MTKRITAVTAAAMLVAAWAAAGERESLQMIGEGRALFVTNCAGCHGTDARGLSGPDLTGASAVRGFDRRHVANRIEGRRDGVDSAAMPAWGARLERQWPGGRGPAALKIAKLTRYLEFVQAGNAASQAASNPQKDPPRR
jgi:mono/diheme cytochrome c family protein